MSKESFDDLLSRVEPYLTTRLYMNSKRPYISPAEKLAVTLRFLATGNSQISLSFNFRIGRATVSHIVHETCQLLWNVLLNEFLKFPTTEEEWKSIS